HRHEDQAGAHAGELQLERAGVVLGDRRHAVARLQAEAVAEQPGEPADAPVQLGPGQRDARLDAGHRLRRGRARAMISHPAVDPRLHGAAPSVSLMKISCATEATRLPSSSKKRPVVKPRPSTAREDSWTWSSQRSIRTGRCSQKAWSSEAPKMPRAAIRSSQTIACCMVTGSAMV